MHAWIKQPLYGGTDFGKGDQFWQPKLVWPAVKIGPAGPILAAKTGPGDQFWQVFLPKLVQLD